MAEQQKGKLHYAYVIAIGLMLLMIPSSFLSNTASIYYTPVSTELGISLTSYSVCSSIQLWVCAISVTFLGKLLNKMNARVIITIAVILQAACYFVNSLAHNIWVFYVDAVLLGLCHCLFIFLLTPVMINRWFVKRVGTMIGIVGAFQGLGAVVFNTVGAAIIAGPGWRMAFVTWSIVTLVIGLPVAIFIMRSWPADMGITPFGYEALKGEGGIAETVKKLGFKARDAYKSPIFWIGCTASMAIAGADCFNYYLNAYVLSVGVGTVAAGTAASMVMVGNVLGKIVVGAIQDKSKVLSAIVGGGCPTLGFILILLFAKTWIPMIWIGFFFFGVGYGATNVISPDLVRTPFGTRDYANMWSTFVMFQTISCAVCTIFWGALVDNFGFVTGMIVVSCFTLWTTIASLIVYSRSKKLQERWTEE